eukprot:3340843-Prymnesium_polylepis.3
MGHQRNWRVESIVGPMTSSHVCRPWGMGYGVTPDESAGRRTSPALPLSGQPLLWSSSVRYLAIAIPISLTELHALPPQT